MPPEVRQAMVDAAPYFVDMQELNRKAGEIIGRYTGAEDGTVDRRMRRGDGSSNGGLHDGQKPAQSTPTA